LVLCSWFPRGKLGTKNEEPRTKNKTGMSIRRFEDIEGWQLARQLSRLVYGVAMRGAFAKDFGLRDQITRAAICHAQHRRRF
jgi:hypothetical protein